MKVDPECSDHKSLHYAGEDRVYLLTKNKYTDVWEFPTKPMQLSQTFFKAKNDLFTKYTANKWKIKFAGAMPASNTIRDFTKVEEEDTRN